MSENYKEKFGEGVFEVPDKTDKKENRSKHGCNVGNPMDSGHEIIFQMPFITI